MKLPRVKELSADILKCGVRRIYLDTFEPSKLSAATSRDDIRKLIKDGLIVRKAQKIHSRYHANKLMREKEKGRHSGPGKVKGSKNARMPEKDKWIKRIRDLRNTLKELRDKGEITKTEHKMYYQKTKGNGYKNSAALMGAIKQKHDDERRMKEIEEQAKALKIAASEK
ncbi:60S ribosomal protein L19 [Spraguea lophii 42_110]|uniref:60S ribosomal protein L19 n=1 Tax=Spraguea lophii (strain 42_110) TaxID=1358809 RepID=S7WBY9_SPRLO|nr:Chain LR0, 60S ribosomal protein L19 [Spraguea lophii 42_110]7QJH_KR0 Chain KR0, 60S ribosomal protein L19 [Spraguea lophii 42_110]7QJH_LR0 Chain LR0, 60S ribosomal protein L19 [Spraguea lophii 42_110]8BR3_LR0 Chain LR0, 60S ribosomal protein L19 [Spraguea lophii 42_110]8P5D_LR0 Chain LR0, 60S ribosomal protein L19 [Spraguea lophii 42_110]8P60_KR0 Chain KR0, 60S ribosomal protein L19 [Spraguea lophii 42_110]8P60_LR0 Chain LR0, 60S ribosomal protein L19 [Spraguea lophii 42_110]EPR79277.1 6